MHLDSKVIDINKKKENGTNAEKLEGEFLNYFQVVEDDGKIEFRIIKQLKKKEYILLTDEIAIDLRLKPLFATDREDLFGRSFFDVLKAFDKKITKRMASLQRECFKIFVNLSFLVILSPKAKGSLF
jgi:putative transposase